MMLLYSMLRSTASIWRAQTQLPPAPQRTAQAWMTSWYATHEFEKNKQVLVFVIDGRTPPHKVCAEMMLICVMCHVCSLMQMLRRPYDRRNERNAFTPRAKACARRRHSKNSRSTKVVRILLHSVQLAPTDAMLSPVYVCVTPFRNRHRRRGPGVAGRRLGSNGSKGRETRHDPGRTLRSGRTTRPTAKANPH